MPQWQQLRHPRTLCYRHPPAAASANATKKSFAVTLQQPDNKSKAARDRGSSAAANGKSTGKDDGLKSRSFAFLGMPADEDWIL